MRLDTLSTLAGLAILVSARPLEDTTSSLVAKDSIAMQPRSAPYGKIITACARPKTIAITFDDGPGAYTEDLLDILATNNVRATFFVNGDNGPAPLTSPGSSDSLKRAFESGHQIASHTWSHQDLQQLSTAQRISEMQQLEKAFVEIIGVIPTYMRPPYTSCGRSCVSDMANLGYHVVSSNLSPPCCPQRC
jgi:peptidoglycan/xylan/chitin deacetylase (PgdA/CDA1 family)